MDTEEDGFTLLVRKVPGGMFTPSCHLSLDDNWTFKAEAISLGGNSLGKYTATLEEVNVARLKSWLLGLGCRKHWLKSVNQKARVVVAGCHFALSVKQVLWNRAASTKPTKRRLKKKTSVAKLRFTKFLALLQKQQAPKSPDMVDV